jgi:REase_AHJR-like
MDNQQRLEQIAQRYREQGYQVTRDPGPDSLPPFAKDFKVEILASRPDGNVLASIKGGAAEFETNPDLSRYAEVIEKFPGWRYDVYALGPTPRTPEPRGAKEASEAEIARALNDAERLAQSGFVAQAVLAAWAAMESAMRHRLLSLGSRTEYGTPPRTMLNDLLSSGIISNSDFRDLEGLSRLRNIISHGFSVPPIGEGTVPFLVSTARRLLTESKQLAMTS